MKQFLLRIYTWSLLSKEKTNYYQKIARDKEWESIKLFIKTGKFLDVGCGAGYAMMKAKKHYSCEVYGIDPNPKGHGVGRIGSNYSIKIDNIVQGFAECLPYNDSFFDIVYSSHVLEHVNDIDASIKEMKRVCKKDGIIIIGVPTATMIIINWITHLLFLTHIKIFNLLFFKLFNTGKTKWWELFVPLSHSFPTRPLFYDLKNYRIKQWNKLISRHLEISKIILPALYPYPDFIQWFKLKQNRKISSSVFFICHCK